MPVLAVYPTAGELVDALVLGMLYQKSKQEYLVPPLLETRRIPVVFDLDETLIFAKSYHQLQKLLPELHKK